MTLVRRLARPMLAASFGPGKAKVTELGGSVMMPPNDMDFGRGAVVADPQGAVFGIAAINEPAS